MKRSAFAIILPIVLACSSTQRHAALECDEAALAAAEPRIAAAIEAKDKVRLGQLALELTAETFACGIQSLGAKAAAGSGSGSGSGGAM